MTPTDGEVLLNSRGMEIARKYKDKRPYTQELRDLYLLVGQLEAELATRPAPQAGEAVAWKATWTEAGFAKGNVFESDPTELLIREGMTDIHVAVLTAAAPQGVRDAEISLLAIDIETELCAKTAEDTEKSFPLEADEPRVGAHVGDYWNGFRNACEEIACRIRLRIKD